MTTLRKRRRIEDPPDESESNETKSTEQETDKLTKEDHKTQDNVSKGEHQLYGLGQVVHLFSPDPKSVSRPPSVTKLTRGSRKWPCIFMEGNLNRMHRANVIWLARVLPQYKVVSIVETSLMFLGHLFELNEDECKLLKNHHRDCTRSLLDPDLLDPGVLSSRMRTMLYNGPYASSLMNWNGHVDWDVSLIKPISELLSTYYDPEYGLDWNPVVRAFILYIGYSIHPLFVYYLTIRSPLTPYLVIGCGISTWETTISRDKWMQTEPDTIVLFQRSAVPERQGRMENDAKYMEPVYDVQHRMILLNTMSSLADEEFQALGRLATLPRRQETDSLFRTLDLLISRVRPRCAGIITQMLTHACGEKNTDHQGGSQVLMRSNGAIQGLLPPIHPFLSFTLATYDSIWILPFVDALSIRSKMVDLSVFPDVWTTMSERATIGQSTDMDKQVVAALENELKSCDFAHFRQLARLCDKVPNDEPES